LGAHDADFFYEIRDELALSAPEIELLARSTIADQSNTCAGYYWLREWSDEQVSDWLITLARDDPHRDVRTGALRLVVLAGYSPPLEWCQSLLSDPSQDVRLAFLKYLEARAKPEDLPLAQALTSDQNPLVSAKAQEVRLKLLAMADPNAAFQELLQMRPYLSDELQGELRGILRTVAPELLRHGLQSEGGALRRLAAQTLADAGNLTPDEARLVALDPVDSVAELGISALIDAGQELDDELMRVATRLALDKLQDFEFASIRTLQPEELLRKLDFYDVHGAQAYRALALDHFPLVEARIRPDLEHGFEELRKASEAKRTAALRTLLGATLPEALREHQLEAVLDPLRKYRDFMASLFTAAALAGLAEHGAPADAEFARRALAVADQPDDVRLQAVKLLARLGSQTDVDLLLSLAEQTLGELRIAAAEAAMTLASGPTGAPARLLQTQNSNLVRLGLRSLLGPCQDEAKPLARQLLTCPRRVERDAALSFLVRVCTS